MQIAALTFMAGACSLRIVWILKFPAARQSSSLTIAQSGRTTPLRGGIHSLLQVVMPWTMSSLRTHPARYFEFAMLHAGIAASIVMSFLIPYAPGTMANAGVAGVLQVLFAAAFAAAAVRLARRAANPYLRSISTPDDYFTLALMLAWFASSVIASLGVAKTGEWPRVTYFLLTAFLFLYTPFSKILHYIYYPFARWYLGRKLAARGIDVSPRSAAGPV